MGWRRVLFGDDHHRFYFALAWESGVGAAGRYWILWAGPVALHYCAQLGLGWCWNRD